MVLHDSKGGQRSIAFEDLVFLWRPHLREQWHVLDELKM